MKITTAPTIIMHVAIITVTRTFIIITTTLVTTSITVAPVIAVIAVITAVAVVLLATVVITTTTIFIACTIIIWWLPGAIILALTVRGTRWTRVAMPGNIGRGGETYVLGFMRAIQSLNLAQ
jgi:hypothetical protein